METRRHGFSPIVAIGFTFILLTSGLLGIIISTPDATYVAYADASAVWIETASTSQGAYAVDDSVTFNVKYAWEGLTSNVTVNLQLWNATDMVEDLANYTVPYNVSGTLTPKGSEVQSYAVTASLTEEVGTYTYYLKLLSGGIVVDNQKVTVVVSEEQITLSLTWQDQNNDRIVDVNEQVTFTAYINWAFIQDAESHNLYVNYGDGEKLLSSVAVTAGSGSQTVTDSIGFSSGGQKTVTFTLKDSTGTVVATRTASLYVGQQSTAETGTTSAPSTTSLVGLVTANWQTLAIILAIAIVGYIYLGRKEPEPKSKSRR